MSVHEAIGYKTHFMGVEIETGPGVLTPRAETELLGKAAIDVLEARSGHRFAIDMCCGSGNLSCAVAMALSDITIWASDLTDDAVKFTRHNVDRLGLSGRVQVCQGDLFSAFGSEQLHSCADLVMCNPPYISTSRLKGERSYLLDSEPVEAFDGGPYGLSVHQRVIKDAIDYLKPGGWVALEIGEGQERQLSALIKRSRGYNNLQFRSNPQGVPRVALIQKEY